jgi:Fe2+ transport system protein FeoA
VKLADLKKGDIFKIVEFQSECPNFLERMAGMGVYPGARGEVLVKSLWGPIEIDLEGRKLALGRGIAKKIEVKKLECPLFG